MKNIDMDDILLFHKKIVRETGGSKEIRDLGLIDSALNRASATFDGIDLYWEIEGKISAITYGLIKNHGFVDGNKRIGVSVMVLLLKLNNINVKYSQKQLIELGLKVADETFSENDIKIWINNKKL
ncbi:type II toxin-antitoxin system death-on-curing family toxin [Clostridium tagluense]|uniref:type II toxin-antitoxin system death-on-curing family toxin n=1 Tax=Clostridium tagluense TaxID=360422 RepID=UPI001C6E90B2|nr:type II toxin-antitoxin system death-on-curing family toxin [Clostridium tagluense]MBW9158109.1 type II toxin-antitoxin system death-on-curing family toxin [Clostridium tagluense]WLC65100.1 type II toxin-antitoxin system death-on-curing family toxin [Clostridium tagluense]